MAPLGRQRTAIPRGRQAPGHVNQEAEYQEIHHGVLKASEAAQGFLVAVAEARPGVPGSAVTSGVRTKLQSGILHQLVDLGNSRCGRDQTDAEHRLQKVLQEAREYRAMVEKDVGRGEESGAIKVPDGVLRKGFVGPRKDLIAPLRSASSQQSPPGRRQEGKFPSQQPQNIYEVLLQLGSDSEHGRSPAHCSQVLWSGTRTAAGCQQLLIGGGVEMILRAMAVQIGTEWFQESACDTLQRISSICKLSKTQCSQAIQAVVSSMTSNPAHEGLQESACGALQSLAHLHGSHATVVQEGGFEAIITAIRRHGCHNHGLLWAACDTLHTITGLEPQHLPGFVQSGGIEAIIEAMVKGPREQPGMPCCFALLQHVAKSSAVAHNRICAARTLHGMKQEWVSQLDSQGNQHLLPPGKVRLPPMASPHGITQGR